MHNLTGLYDVAGRYLAPVPVLVPVRPSGPWDTNAAPRAVFAFVQPGFEELPDLPLYHVVGGTHDQSTVSADTLRGLGITVPVQEAA